MEICWSDNKWLTGRKPTLELEDDLLTCVKEAVKLLPDDDYFFGWEAFEKATKEMGLKTAQFSITRDITNFHIAGSFYLKITEVTR